MTSILDINDFNQQLLTFLSDSPTPFHAVRNMTNLLNNNGFTRLPDNQPWQLLPGAKHWVTRNDSSIVAFVVGSHSHNIEHIRMVGAHTDSPALRVKPNPEISVHGTQQLGVETYGGLLMSPWFDRELSLAGRVTYLDQEQHLQSALIDFKAPIAMIPSIAIHLSRNANKGVEINPEQELPLILCSNDQPHTFNELLQQQLEQQGIKMAQIMSHEIFAYDTQPAAIVGLQQDYIASARLDNLLSCFIGLQALIAADGNETALLICSDHEEVGSASACGAQGPFLEDCLAKIMPACAGNSLADSMMISVDNAHAIHPNYPSKHDNKHGPTMNSGAVIKINANQRYATNSHTQARFEQIAAFVSEPVQKFVVRQDMGCGSTIGPITATEIGVPTIDVGCPQWAMHSIRETAGSKDPYSLFRVLTAFNNWPGALSVSLHDDKQPV